MLVTAVVFMMVVSIASFIQRTASDIEEALFFDVDVRALDVTTVQHTFYINPNQIKQFILNNQTQHQVLLFNGDFDADNWVTDRSQFVPNDFNTQQVVFFRVFPSRVNIEPGVSRTEEFSLIPISLGGPPTENITGQPYVGRSPAPPYEGREGEPPIYANNAQENYSRYIDVSSAVSGGFYNLIHAFVINAQEYEFAPSPNLSAIQYRVNRWLNHDGSLILTITPTLNGEDIPTIVPNPSSWRFTPLDGRNDQTMRPAWLTHPRVVDMVQRW